MPLIIVIVIGLSLNIANTHPHSLADVQIAFNNQFTHPVISAGGPYNK